jgi:hypothetical protein
MTIEVCDLGDWGAASLLAEYDRACDAIRINARAVARVRATLGDAMAARFVECAVAHERFHRDNPEAGEREAHAHAHARCGIDPRAFESVLR